MRQATMKSAPLLRMTAKFGTSSYREWVKRHLMYSAVSLSFENFVGLAYLYSAAFQIATVLILTVFFNVQTTLSFMASVATFFAIFLMFHLSLSFIADSRARAMEEVMPDMLRLMSMNLKSGMTADRALLLSARPEFGIMESEIKDVAKKVISGVPIETALQEMSDRTNSRVIEKTIKLISEGLRKGGELSTLLEQLADDIVHTKTLRKEIAAQVGMYSIFIFFAAGVGAPLLYSVSTFLIQTMTKISSSVGAEQAPAMQAGLGSIQFKKIDIDLDFLMGYELAALFITSLFGGMLIGLLKEGNEKAGLKTFPVLLALNLSVFFAVRYMLASFMPV